MSAPLPHPTDSIDPSLHPAIGRVTDLPDSMPSIQVCPLPYTSALQDHLIPELSHELKTPLTGILGLAQVLQNQSVHTPQRERQYADLIYQKSHQLLLSINDLLDFAQLSRHQLVLELRPVSVLSVLKTAFQTLERTTGTKISVASVIPVPEGEEGWMMGDRPRLEQLFVHVLGYCHLEQLLDTDVTLKLHVHRHWLEVTLTSQGTTPFTEDTLPDLFQSHTDHHPAFSPSRASLKLHLAQQLLQWQGGDLSGHISSNQQVNVTVLLPQDLTHATPLHRAGSPEPLLLIYSPDSAIADQTAEAIRYHAALTAIARSPLDIPTKIQILSPVALVLDGQTLEQPGISSLKTLLLDAPVPTALPLVWLNTNPAREGIHWDNVLEPWVWPLQPTQIQQTLHQLQHSLASPQISHSSPSPASIVILQLDLDPTSPPIEPFKLKVLTQLSQDFSCSVLAVGDPDQAELLARIWKPHIILCPGDPPAWLLGLPPDAPLHQFPLLCLHQGDRPSKPFPIPWGYEYSIDVNLSLPQAAKLLYQTLIQNIRH